MSFDLCYCKYVSSTYIINIHSVNLSFKEINRTKKELQTLPPSQWTAVNYLSVPLVFSCYFGPIKASLSRDRILWSLPETDPFLIASALAAL